VAALVVFTAHLLIVLVPNLIAVNGGIGWAARLTTLGKSPLAVLWNGNSGVCVFFILSGYVMTDFARHTTLSLPAQSIRRYLRLAIPILITSVFSWALLYLGLMHNVVDPDLTGGWLANWYRFEPSALHMIYEALAGTFLTGSNAYNPNLWTMEPELMGSLFVMLFCTIARGRVERTLLFALLMVLYRGDYLPLFAVGALLHDYERELALLRGAAAIVMFIAGLYICSLPSVGPDIALPWHVLLPRIFSFDNDRYWHSIGAMLIVAALLQSEPLQAAFASRVGRFLGRISFTLYLIHIPLLASFTAALMLAMKETGRLPTVLVAGSVTVALVLVISWLASDVVDGAGVRLSRAAGRLWMRLLAQRQAELEATPIPAASKG
jgi:peptidoglycan/LPS O-acetylase OafA/YrhL